MEQEIKAKFTAENADFKAKAKENIGLLDKAIKTAKQKVQMTLDIGNLASGAVSAIKSVGGNIIMAGVAYESAITRAGANFGMEKNTEQFAQLNDYAKKLGSTTSFTSKEAADGLNFLAKAGYTAADSMAALPQLMNMSIATGVDLASTSDMVTDAMGAFGVKVKDMAHFQDVLAQTTLKSNVNLNQLFQSLKTVAPVAHTLGFSVEETAASIGLLGAAGIKGEQAGTHLKSFMANLVKPTAEMTKTMDQYGISITDSTGKMKPFSKIIANIRTATKNLTKEDKARVLTTLAGKEALASTSVLLEQTTEDYAKYIDALKKSDGAAKHLADMNKNTLGYSLTMLSSAISGFNLLLFDTSKGGIAIWVSMLTSAINAVTELTSGNMFLKGMLIGVSNWFSTAAIAVALLYGGLGAYNVVVGAAAILTRVLGTSLRFAMGWLGLVITAIAGIITAWDWLKDKFGFGDDTTIDITKKSVGTKQPVSEVANAGNPASYDQQVKNQIDQSNVNNTDMTKTENYMAEVVNNTRPKNKGMQTNVMATS